ncbi:uncharacterized mitochondrial protein-like protein [Tanacetum coccineum]
MDEGTVSNDSAGTSKENSQDCIVMPIWKDTSYFDSPTKDVDNDDIIFGSTNKELCTGFEKLMKDKFQMSSMGELTFFLGLQVQQKEDGIFISQDKYELKILKEIQTTLISMIGSLMYLTVSRPDIMFTDSPFDWLPYTDSDLAEQHIIEKNYYCQANVNGVKMTWAPKLQLLFKFLSLKALFEGAVLYFITTKSMDERMCYIIKLGDRMERATTTASSLEAEQDSVNVVRLKLVLPVFVSAIKRMLMLSVQVSAVEVNPIIYTSCIEQFWATAKVQTVNGVRQLQALVDKKRVIVTESSIRRDLHLDDAEGLKRLRKVGMSRRVESSKDQESLGALKDASKQGRSIKDIDADVDVDVMHVEAKVDGKDEQSTKPDNSTTGKAVTTASVDDS